MVCGLIKIFHQAIKNNNPFLSASVEGARKEGFMLVRCCWGESFHSSELCSGRLCSFVTTDTCQACFLWMFYSHPYPTSITAASQDTVYCNLSVHLWTVTCWLEAGKWGMAQITTCPDSGSKMVYCMMHLSWKQTREQPATRERKSRVSLQHVNTEKWGTVLKKMQEHPGFWPEVAGTPV